MPIPPSKLRAKWPRYLPIKAFAIYYLTQSVISNTNQANLAKSHHAINKIILKKWKKSLPSFPFRGILKTMKATTTTTPNAPKSLLSIDTNAKTVKGQKKGFMTGILYLAPANESGRNLCAHASDGCKAACLFSAGRGAFDSVRNARMNKTRFFIEHRAEFVAIIKADIARLVKKAAKANMTPAVRLNGTSDLPWENIGDIMQSFPNVQFYDYTPNPKRMISFIKGELPANYHLTFSKKENNDSIVDLILTMGGNVAVVFDSQVYTYKGKQVVSGDETDLRFLDPKNVIVGLTAKGKAKKDTSGFVVKVPALA